MRKLLFTLIFFSCHHLPCVAAENSKSLISAYNELSSDRPGQARVILEGILKRDPGNLDARRLLCHALVRSNRHSQAIVYMVGITCSSSSIASDHTLLGDCYLNLQAIDKAEREFRKALSKSQSESTAACGLIRCMIARQQFDEARTLCDQTLKITKNERARKYIAELKSQLDEPAPSQVDSRG